MSEGDVGTLQMDSGQNTGAPNDQNTENLPNLTANGGKGNEIELEEIGEHVIEENTNKNDGSDSNNTDEQRPNVPIANNPEKKEEIIKMSQEPIHGSSGPVKEELGKASTQPVKPSTNFDAEVDTLQIKTKDKTDDSNRGESRLSLAFSSSRKFIAWVTPGKIGPGFLVAPLLFMLVVHIMMFILGVLYSSSCTAKPLVPVAMVLLGGDGLLKSLSYLLQVTIVIQTKMTRANALLFMSESSVLDNGLNLLYICAVFMGAAGVFTGEVSTCQMIIFELMFYYIIIAFCILGLLLILFIWKLIKPNKDRDFIDERGNIIH